ncbi:SDR family oxidoreductase [Amycolatopsis ultiminotia]|uniref:SDR family oxidoreductase n=1 Tax=Amycolatopsis ultiminotia TaxID=543629 RepID=A0ABP6XJC4_9PSEU
MACASALAAEGVDLVLNGRNADRLADAAARLRAAHEVAVTEVVADVTTADGRGRLLDCCPEPDILVTNNNGPSPGTFTEFTEEDWMTAVSANMVSQLMLVSTVVPGMRARHFGRIVNITSAMVTTPRPTMGLSSAARAGLTAALKGLSFEVVRDNVTINNLLPERIDTDRQRFMAARVMEREGITYEVARTRQEASVAAGRLGTPEEFGVVCAFLCSARAGFVSGNNVHVDGGTYPALI